MIKVNQLSFKYEGAEDMPYVLKDVSFEVPTGAFVAILGHNGSGKSTLAKLLNAIYVPTEGSIQVAGYDTKDHEALWQIREKAGIVFQNPDNQIVATIVEEDVAFGPENLGVPSEQIRIRVNDALSKVGMLDYAKRQPHQLSGGQKQRVAIAGVLAMLPNCIIFDEPTAMLDPIGRKEVMETIVELNKKLGITVLLITHFMEEALLADQVLVLNEGDVVRRGTPVEVFSDVDAMKGYQLDVPYGAQIAHALRGKGLTIPSDIMTIEELVRFLADKRRQNPFADAVSDVPEVRVKNGLGDVIQMEALNYVYNPQSIFEVKALQDINLNIEKQAFIGLIGHTGSGKSTLIQQMNGLLKPSSGRMTILDVDIQAKGTKLVNIRKQVGLVFQYPEYQLFEETVFKDVAYGPSHLGLDEMAIKARVIDALQLVGIQDETILEKSPFELSGGQKRRVAIAGVLAMKPQVLILDEPTAGLDPKGRRDILRAIQDIHERENITVILVSHSMEEIAQMVDKIIVMEKGQILRYDLPTKVFLNQEELNRVGLDLPLLTRLIYDLNTHGFGLDVHHFDQGRLVQDILSRLEVSQ